MDHDKRREAPETDAICLDSFFLALGAPCLEVEEAADFEFTIQNSNESPEHAHKLTSIFSSFANESRHSSRVIEPP